MSRSRFAARRAAVYAVRACTVVFLMARRSSAWAAVVSSMRGVAHRPVGRGAARVYHAAGFPSGTSGMRHSEKTPRTASTSAWRPGSKIPGVTPVALFVLSLTLQQGAPAPVPPQPGQAAGPGK